MKSSIRFLLGVSMVLSGCDSTQGIQTLLATGTLALPSPLPSVFPSEPCPSPSPSTPVVCGISGQPTAPSSVSGVVATMKYLPSSSYSWNSGSSVVSNECNYENPTSSGCPDGLGLDYSYMDANGVSASAIFYFPSVDVVPQEFLLGFPTADGGVVKDNSGNVLTSYFSLDFLSQIQLAPGQSAGWYQFATISDDGSILNLDVNGTGELVPVVNNDYWHGAIMQCASQAVYMEPNTPIKMDLQYFQGAPVSIAMMVLWRQVSSATPPSDPYCGADNIPLDSSGNPELSSATYCSGTACENIGGPNYFTQSATGSTQNALFGDLLSSGGSGAGAWQVLTPANYLLPVDSGPNPCVSPSPSPTVSSSPSASPSPSPSTASPTPSPSVTPSATPSTCSGPSCGGGVLGE